MSVRLFHQYRSPTEIYFFQAKGADADYCGLPDTLSLKVYDLSHKCTSKSSCKVSASELQTLFFQTPKISTFLTYFPNQKPPSSFRLVEDPLAALEKLIASFKPAVVLKDHQIDALLCPITQDILEDPVIDTCGHTFTRAAIQKHLQTKSTCPISRKTITTKDLTVNRIVQDQIEKLKNQDPVLTLSKCKKENSKLADLQLQVAASCMEAQDYQAALDAYALAFQHTNQWQAYQKLPSLYHKLGHPAHSELATLYLIYYQLKAKAISEAADTLTSLVDTLHSSSKVHLSLILVQLYDELHMQGSKAVDLALNTAQSCEKEFPRQAKLLYSYAFYIKPHALLLSTDSALLLFKKSEIIHFYLHAACYSIEQNNGSEETRKYLEHASKYRGQSISSFSSLLDEYPFLELLMKDDKLRDLQQKLILLKMDYTGSSFIKICRLAQKIPSTFSIDCDSFIQTQIQLKPNKAFTWISDHLQYLQKRPLVIMSATGIDEFYEAVSRISHLYKPTISVYEAFLELYKRARAENAPKKIEILTHLAKAHTQQGNHPAAEAYYSQVATLAPSYANFLDLARCLNGQLATKPDKIAQTIHTYFQAVTSTLTSHPEVLDIITSLDPSLKHLDATQRIQFFTLQKLSQLESNQTILNNTIAQMAQQIGQLQNTVEQMKRRSESTGVDWIY
jgi:tetratricopeptide (TPR) repeat protein